MQARKLMPVNWPNKGKMRGSECFAALVEKMTDGVHRKVSSAANEDPWDC